VNGLVFGAPAHLALLALWPALLLLARRAAERRPRPAADFELWRRAAERLGAPPVRRAFSRRDLALLAPLVLLTLALAEPAWRREAGARRVVVLMDRSASMGAAVGGVDRLARGLRAAAGLPEAREPRFVGVPAPAQGERASSPAPVAVDPSRLAAEAAALFAAGEPVLVVTDRDDLPLPPGVGLVRVVDDVVNAGIVACAPTPEGLFVRLAGDAGAAPRELRVENREGGEILSVRVGDPSAARFVLDLGGVQDATLRLLPLDRNPLDDVVRLVARPRPARAAVVLPRGDALLRALRAQPELEVVAGPDPEADLIVAHDASAARDGRALLLVPPFRDARGFSAGEAAAADGPTLGRGAFEGFAGESARFDALHAAAGVPEGARTALAVSDAPLVSLDAATRTAALWTDPGAGGDWATTAGFPLAIRRVVAALDALGSAEFAAVGAPLDPSESRSRTVGPGGVRGPAVRVGELDAVPLGPWCAAAAAVVFLALVVYGATGRRRAAPAAFAGALAAATATAGAAA
jgi:hypothetical protein